MIDRRQIRSRILEMAESRSAEKTVCPSEVARALGGTDEKVWRQLMAPIRQEAVKLADEGHILIKRKGRVVDPHEFKGIYRLSIVRGVTETE